MPPTKRNRDFFVAIVAGGLALTGCSSDDDVPADAAADMAVADAGADMAVEDFGMEDADDDTFVAIL